MGYVSTRWRGLTQPLIWSIRREWQDIVSRGLFWTSMPFPSVEQPNLEAAQSALVLLHE